MISLDARVVSVAKSHLILELGSDIEKNAVFLLNCPVLADSQRSGLYLRVVQTEAVVRSSLFHLTCEMIPISDQPSPGVEKWIHAREVLEPSFTRKDTWSDSQSDSEAPSEAIELFFLKAQPLLFDVGKLVIGLFVLVIVGLLLYYYMPRTQTHSVVPAETTDVFRAIKDVFK